MDYKTQTDECMNAKTFLVVALLIIAAGCTTQAEDPASVVLKHLEARTKSSAEQLQSLTCAAQENQVGMLAKSLEGLDAQLKDVVCTFDGSSTVNCTGSISVNYQGEIRELAVGNYSVVQEDGQWKWCGEAK